MQHADFWSECLQASCTLMKVLYTDLYRNISVQPQVVISFLVISHAPLLLSAKPNHKGGERCDMYPYRDAVLRIFKHERDSTVGING